MSRTFRFSKNEKVILYGAAFLGKIVFETLSCQGYHIEAFIDARAEEIAEKKGKPVYTIDELEKQYKDDKEIVIVIAVKNVFEHSKIALALANKGFNNIIYKPYEVIKGTGTKAQEKLSDMFDAIQDKKIIEEAELEKTENKSFLAASSKYLICETDEEVLAYVPANYICRDRGNDDNNVEMSSLYLYPHIQFFEFLQGKSEASPQYYIDYCKSAAKNKSDFETTLLWERNVVRNRTLVFEEMSNAFAIDREFFIRSAAKVVWNVKGYFNLDSGKHRVAFLISKGLMYIPVRMSKKDYECWINRECAKRIFDKMSKEIVELKAPIEHPFFYEYPCSGKNFIENTLFHLTKCFSKLWYTNPEENFLLGKKMYIEVNDNGYFSRHFRRTGCLVYNALNNDISTDLEELFMISNKEKDKISEENDVAIVTVDDIEMFSAKRDKIIAKHWIVICPDKCFENVEHSRYITGGACDGIAFNVCYVKGVE